MSIIASGGKFAYGGGPVSYPSKLGYAMPHPGNQSQAATNPVPTQSPVPAPAPSQPGPQMPQIDPNMWQGLMGAIMRNHQLTNMMMPMAPQMPSWSYQGLMNFQNPGQELQQPQFSPNQIPGLTAFLGG